MSPIERLKVELPADWQPVTDQPAESWRGDPTRTVSLQIGERRLFVSFRRHGGWVNGPYDGTYIQSWLDLRIEIRRQTAKCAVDHARVSKPIPSVPEWAHRHLQRQAGQRIDHLHSEEAKRRTELDRIIAEREALSALAVVTP